MMILGGGGGPPPTPPPPAAPTPQNHHITLVCSQKNSKKQSLLWKRSILDKRKEPLFSDFAIYSIYIYISYLFIVLCCYISETVYCLCFMFPLCKHELSMKNCVGSTPGKCLYAPLGREEKKHYWNIAKHSKIIAKHSKT